jgi:hypothetical protein
MRFISLDCKGFRLGQKRFLRAAGNYVSTSMA